MGCRFSSELIALMGGQLSVESEPGHGSTFRFTVRLACAAAPEAIGLDAAADALAGLHVLIVDDNTTNQQVLRHMLTRAGMAPTVVGSGPEAIAAVAASRRVGPPIDLVLLDVNMPGMSGFEVAERLTQDPLLRTAAILMLTSSDQVNDGARSRDSGPERLPRQAGEPGGAVPGDDDRRSAPGATSRLRGPRRSSPIRTGPARRILLAEDNVVNQKVALHMLQKLGDTVDVVATGRAAVEAVASRPYDLVLMDVQMPEMNGTEAAIEIRRREQGTGVHLPILALTAHADRRDREACLSAGMDAYLAKPFHAEGLRDAIARLMAGGEPRTMETPPAQETVPPDGTGDDGQAVRDRILASFSGDATSSVRLRALFLSEYPGRLREIKEALGRGEAEAIARGAHGLKGSVGFFSKNGPLELAQRLEEVAKAGALGDAPPIVDALEAELGRLHLTLAPLAAA